MSRPPGSTACMTKRLNSSSGSASPSSLPETLNSFSETFICLSETLIVFWETRICFLETSVCFSKTLIYLSETLDPPPEYIRFNLSWCPITVEERVSVVLRMRCRLVLCDGGTESSLLSVSICLLSGSRLLLFASLLQLPLTNV